MYKVTWLTKLPPVSARDFYRPLIGLLHFSIFQDGGHPRHLGFLKVRIFNCWSSSVGQYASVIMPNVVLIGQTFAEISRFWDFSGWRLPPSCNGFFNFKFVTVRTVKRVELRQRANFRRNCSNRDWNMAIFRFFQDGGRPPSWICDACTIHEGLSMVFITVQNLVEIDAVVLIICTFFDFASLAW